MSNLALNLVGTARRIPDRKAAISDDDTMTYAELDAATSRMATFLDREGSPTTASGGWAALRCR